MLAIPFTLNIGGEGQLTVSETLAVPSIEQWREIQGLDVEGTTVSFTNWQVSEPLQVQASDPSPFTYNVAHVVVIGLDDSVAPVIFATVSALEAAVALNTGTELPAILVTVTVPEACVVQASDIAQPPVAVASTADACAVATAAESAAIVSILSLSDTGVVQASESVLVASTLAIAESAGLGATEALVILATGTVVDSAAAQTAEAAVILATISVEESCAVVANDAATPLIDKGTTPILASEACAVLASEAVASLTVTAIAIDSCAIQAVELASISSTISTLDSTALGSAEAAQLTVAMTAADAVALVVAEQQPILFVMQAAADSITLGAQDSQPLIPLTLSAADAVALPSLDLGTKQDVSGSIQLSVTDSLVIGLSDAAQPPSITVVVTDNCQFPIDERTAAPVVPAEVVALLLLEDARLAIDEHEFIWGGGMRLEPAHFLFVGSYRMGERNADETRGGTW